MQGICVVNNIFYQSGRLEEMLGMAFVALVFMLLLGKVFFQAEYLSRLCEMNVL